MHEERQGHERREPFGKYHRAGAWTATAMGRGKGLVQIDVHGIDSEIPRFHPADDGVEIRPVAVEIGASRVHGSYRLFMAPGMAHCGGGDGPNTFDMVGALEQWVERGTAPDRVIASHVTKGVVDRTRPLCPYPNVAAYTGTGSTDEAANFVCKSTIDGGRTSAAR